MPALSGDGRRAGRMYGTQLVLGDGRRDGSTSGTLRRQEWRLCGAAAAGVSWEGLVAAGVVGLVAGTEGDVETFSACIGLTVERCRLASSESRSACRSFRFHSLCVVPILLQACSSNDPRRLEAPPPRRFVCSSPSSGVAGDCSGTRADSRATCFPLPRGRRRRYTASARASPPETPTTAQTTAARLPAPSVETASDSALVSSTGDAATPLHGTEAYVPNSQKRQATTPPAPQPRPP
jgi:hypothetical protein